jgi:pyruvate/2-oxoglutarate dehydrogenase complex dihydrolipoamide acyltransferase (E2) component
LKKIKDLPLHRKLQLNFFDDPTYGLLLNECEIDMTETLAWVKEMRAIPGLPRITVFHAALKAVAIAMEAVPPFNIVRQGRTLKRPDAISITFPIRIEHKVWGRQTDVRITDLEKKSVADIAREVEQLAASVKSEESDLEASAKKYARLPSPILFVLFKLMGALYALGVSPKTLGVSDDLLSPVLVTNAGSFGLKHGYAPMFPLGLHTSLVSMGVIEKKPVVNEKGEIVVRPMMRVAGTYDHKIVDFYEVHVFHEKIQEVLQAPRQYFQIPELKSAKQALQ